MATSEPCLAQSAVDEPRLNPTYTRTSGCGRCLQAKRDERLTARDKTKVHAPKLEDHARYPRHFSPKPALRRKNSCENFLFEGPFFQAFRPVAEARRRSRTNATHDGGAGPPPQVGPAPPGGGPPPASSAAGRPRAPRGPGRGGGAGGPRPPRGPRG